VPLALSAFLVAGLLIPGAWAGIFLLALGLALAWLVALSWPAIIPSARVIRVLVVGVVIAAAFWRFAGYG